MSGTVAGRFGRALGPLILIFLFPACVHSGVRAGILEVDERPEEEPRVTLVASTGERILLFGDLAGELEQIPRAIVRVKGRERGRAKQPRMVVTRYQILDAGMGVPPHVGMLRWDGGRLLLYEEGGAVVELVGPLSYPMRQESGAKAWVVGPIVNLEELDVREYGILRRAP